MDNVESQYDFENAFPQLAFRVYGESLLQQCALHDGSRQLLRRRDQLDQSGGVFTGFQTFKPVVFWDLEGTYRFNEENFALSLGGRNIFDEYPDEIDRVRGHNDQCCGRKYSSATFVPWQGGYYYARLRADF